MDITLMVILGSAIIILIVISIGFKLVLDMLRKSQIENKKWAEETQNLFSTNYEKLFASIEAKSNDIVAKFILELHKNLEQNSNNFRDINSLINKTVLSLENSTKTNVSLIQKEIAQQYTIVLNQIEHNSKINEENKVILDTKLNNNLSNIISIVNNLRLNNLINVSNEIGKYRNGIYEDTHFIQEVGHCKIFKLTDKTTGEITNIHYDENGEKLYTETYVDDILQYKMNYRNKKLKNGIEFNKNGNVLFEYFYDEAEEISKKLEYIYDEEFNLTETQETNY